MFGSPNRLTKPKRRRPLLTAAGRAGPRRLFLLTLAAGSVIGLGAIAMTRGINASSISVDARRRGVDPLPGGFLSSPEQDAVAFHADTQAAATALSERRSSTPPLSPSVRLVDGKLQPDPDVAAKRPPRPPPPPPLASSSPPPPVYPAPVVIPAVARINVPSTAAAPASPTPAMKVQYSQAQQSRNDSQQRLYDQQMKDLIDQWSGRPPQTDVVLPPPDSRNDPSSTSSSQAAPSRPADLPGIQSVSNRQDIGGQILVPAGRGIYAHPILKLSSDTGGPVVLQADSGLIAGDRLVGSFTQQGNRLVIKIDNVIHHGEPISASGFVVSPDTKEAGVASDVDQNLLSRFVLPAAAAFVQGLGSAIATTSNSVAVLSPLGGATTSTNLNLNQQLGVAAGVAASNVGSTLNAAAPKGPTVTLDAGVTVGVMFLSNVTSIGNR